MGEGGAFPFRPEGLGGIGVFAEIRCHLKRYLKGLPMILCVSMDLSLGAPLLPSLPVESDLRQMALVAIFVRKLG